jgi:hypothetical protein
MLFTVLKRIAEFITDHPRSVVFLIVVAALLSVYPASQIRTDFNLEGFYPQDDPIVTEYQDFIEEFGRDDDIIMIAYEDSSLLTKTGLRFLKSLTDSLQAIKYVDEVQSLWTIEDILNENNTLLFDPYLEEAELETLDSDLLAARLLSDPFIKRLLLSDDGRATALLVNMQDDDYNYNTRSRVIEDVSKLLENYPDRDFKVSGIPYFRNQYVNMLNEEIIFYIAFSSALIVMLLWYLYRSVMGLIIPMLIVWLTVLFTVAVIQLTGGYFEIMSSTIAPILLCVGVADSIHMISKYDDAIMNGSQKRKAIIETLITLGTATFLTSITTAIGFGTLMTSSVVPMKRFGIYTAVGVLIAYMVTILFLPALLKGTGTNRVFKENGGKLYVKLAEWLDQLTLFNRKYYRQIVAITLIASTIIGLGMSKLRVNGYVFDDIGRSSVLIQDANFFSENLAPPFPLEIMIDTGEEYGITDPEMLRDLQEVEDFLYQFEEVKKITSFNTLIQEIHAVMDPESASVNPIPDDPDLIAQYLLLLEFNENDLLDDVIDFNYQKLRVATLTLDAGSIRISEIRDELQLFMAERFPKESIQITGSTILSADLVGKIVYSLASSIGLAFIAISIIMAFLFKEFKLVIISLIPNILPLVVIAGFMGYFGVDIKPSSAVIFTIAFGIAVDDTIHYLARLKVELQRGYTLADALQITTQKTGRAIIITSMILVAGFGSLISSAFSSTMLMGILVCGTIITALIADLILLPALFYLTHPKEMKESATRKEVPESGRESLAEMV